MKRFAVGILGGALLAASAVAFAADIKSTLEQQKGNRVSLRLAGGQDELTGKVAAVSDGTVHLTELAGRDFFDAVVELDDIAAVVFRAKGK